MKLVQNVLRLGLGGIGLLGIHLAIRTGQREFDQNVANLHRLRNAELGGMLPVIALQLVVGHLGRVRQPRRIDQHKLDLALFRNGVGKLLLIFLVEGAQFGVVTETDFSRSATLSTA